MEKLYVLYNMQSDGLNNLYLITEDKFDEFLKTFENNILNNEKNPHFEEIVNFNKNEDSISWKIKLKDDYLSTTYSWLTAKQIERKELNYLTYKLHFFISTVNGFLTK